MITNSTLERRDDILAVIGTHQSQHARGLMFTVTLLLEQPFQEATGHFSQLTEPLPQLLQLASVVFRRAVLWIHAFLPGLSQVEQVTRELPDVAIVNEEFRFRDANRQHLSHSLPRHGILVVLINNEAFHIHHAVDDTRRVVVMRGERQEVGLFLGVRIHGSLLGAAMSAHIGHVRQPPASDFVQMLQAAEGASIE